MRVDAGYLRNSCCQSYVVCSDIVDTSGNVHTGLFFQAEDGIRGLVRSRGLGDVYKRQRPDAQPAGGHRGVFSVEVGLHDLIVAAADGRPQLSLIHI